MLSTIEFNHQLGFKTDEIDDVTTNQILTLKLVTGQSPIPDCVPELSFSIRGIAAHFSCVNALLYKRLAAGSGAGCNHLTPSP